MTTKNEGQGMATYHIITSSDLHVAAYLHSNSFFVVALTVAAIIFNHIKSIGLIIFCGLFAINTGLYKNSNELNEKKLAIVS